MYIHICTYIHALSDTNFLSLSNSLSLSLSFTRWLTLIHPIWYKLPISLTQFLTVSLSHSLLAELSITFSLYRLSVSLSLSLLHTHRHTRPCPFQATLIFRSRLPLLPTGSKSAKQFLHLPSYSAIYITTTFGYLILPTYLCSFHRIPNLPTFLNWFGISANRCWGIR